MIDILIRDIPEAVLTAIERNATSLGISRSEHLRRLLAQAAVPQGETTTADWLWFGEAFIDLDDLQIMEHAWQ